MTKPETTPLFQSTIDKLTAMVGIWALQRLFVCDDCEGEEVNCVSCLAVRMIEAMRGI